MGAAMLTKLLLVLAMCKCMHALKAGLHKR